mgnify:CR=1 FL=1
MTIKKFLGNTVEEATEKAKQEFGPAAVIMNVKEIKPKGIFGFLKNTSYEVTAAVEEKEQFLNAVQMAAMQQKKIDNINLVADEKIDIPPAVNEKSKDNVPSPAKENLTAKNESSSEIEKKLENLSNILEKKLSEDGISERNILMEKKSAASLENFKFMKMLYRTLLKNDVNEKYVNQILDEVDKVTHSGVNVDIILSNVYQKMILKFGQPNCIEMSGKKPRVIFFVGPTGVGKTTTIAKVAAKSKVENDKKVALLTADTYRIAAADQLRVYANILNAPVGVVYSAEELNRSLEDMTEYDLVFVDTAGFSHKNEEQREDIRKLINGLDKKYQKEIYLVLSATTKYKDLVEIVDCYKKITDYKIIFTKLDETTSFGNILNVRLYSGADLSYMTNGQSVPDDLEVFNTQMIVKQLLGGK